MTPTAQDKDPLARYMTEVKRFPLLSREEEYNLAIRLRDTGQREAAHALVTSNLRFVVKIAMEYRAYGMRILDLVQEGNVGLMHAVKKFDPDRGYRLITYAVWWIRAYMQSHLVRTFSLVKLGTTQAQRKLFFRLKPAKKHLSESQPADWDTMSEEERCEKLAEHIGVRKEDVSEMQMRLSGRDFSLDLALEENGETTHLDLLVDAQSANSDALVFDKEFRERMREEFSAALSLLNAREREVIELRHLAETPPTLREVGERWGVSRERARQVEASVREKMKWYLLEKSKVLYDVFPELAGNFPQTAAS
jgi:RNA polymerase sigma-32 factor